MTKQNGFALKIVLVLVVCSGEVKGQCSPPPGVPLMVLTDIKPMDVFPEGASVKYKCAHGYQNRGGSPKSTCINKGWTTPTLLCKPISCGSPGEILNGQFIISEGIHFGSTVWASCNEGYNLVGRKTRECLQSGWSVNIPVCEVVTCPPPPQIEHGEVVNVIPTRVQYRDVIEYRCNKFHLIGESEIFCTNYGNYSGPPPQCKAITCPDPSLPNGRIWRGRKNPYEYRDVVTFSCNPGYEMEGSGSITCEEHGWSPAILHCHRFEPPTTEPPTDPAEECNLWCQFKKWLRNL
ncbi:complement component receptor 1-like protein isoform X2 [Amia ocellicauda]|uniref:complement component receptor 1-like protein isoform X2 n=1 Tax=Amia ocellicauda TaxID=2972642 RepID=UPI003464CBEA